ncbi:hypothetical protein PtA15_16A356 [Puccinia triticina]|uniref:Exoribonuclease phosphorolytic domain-containing protein n=1 Tax=Puccinia triticina TaxID=208348 RepID=A0ABY7D5T9_9BASI|nr:uncharacterized protein PtA15_16A356 [Puccinia triticina]WAQ92448.1 hypothetical protein PtA15_16A356 [Puccinia triticina]
MLATGPSSGRAGALLQRGVVKLGLQHCEARQTVRETEGGVMFLAASAPAAEILGHPPAPLGGLNSRHKFNLFWEQAKVLQRLVTLNASQTTRPATKSLAHSIKLFFTPLILLNKYPRSLIQINLQTLSKPTDRWTNGFLTASLEQSPVPLFDETQSVTEKAALINAASLALLDAGVGMRGCAFAVAVAIIPASAARSNHSDQALNSDQIVLDPNN